MADAHAFVACHALDAAPPSCTALVHLAIGFRGSNLQLYMHVQKILLFIEKYLLVLVLASSMEYLH